MPLVPFDTLPDEARLWVFAADRPLTGSDAEALLERVDAFLLGWEAHGAPLTAGRYWQDDRFLMVAVDERSTPSSGCAVDALVSELKAFEQEVGCGLTDHGAVHRRGEDGQVIREARPAFAQQVASGEVTPQTPVFDATLTRLTQLRRGEFEVPAERAWHRRAFFRSALAD
jgi:hypothetical protein